MYFGHLSSSPSSSRFLPPYSSQFMLICSLSVCLSVCMSVSSKNQTNRRKKKPRQKTLKTRRPFYFRQPFLDLEPTLGCGWCTQGHLLPIQYQLQIASRLGVGLGVLFPCHLDSVWFEPGQFSCALFRAVHSLFAFIHAAVLSRLEDGVFLKSARHLFLQSFSLFFCIDPWFLLGGLW